MANADLKNLISSLESLCSSLQETALHNPTSLDSKICDAALQASHVIKATLPSEQQAAWLSELDSLTDATPPHGAKTHSENQKNLKEEKRSDAEDELSCRCDTRDNRREERIVGCIYGCDALFCSATCRKRSAHEHARVCSALERKRALRSLGLAANDELF